MHDLHEWLVKINSSGLFRTHGFLFAINASPATIDPSVWMPAMTAPDLRGRVSTEDLQYYLDMCMQTKIELAEHMSQDLKIYPMIDFELMLPFEYEKMNDEQQDNLMAWCKGCLQGIRLDSGPWQQLPEFDNFMIALRCVAREKTVATLFGMPQGHLSEGQCDKLYADMVQSLPVLTGVIYDQAAKACPEPKANFKLTETSINLLYSGNQAQWQAPCHCGSGKSFEACCAIKNDRLH